MKKSVYIPHALIEASLEASSIAGKRLLEPLKSFSIENSAPVHILENENLSNPPEIHRMEADLWICISGEPIFTVGGVLIGMKPQMRSDGTVNEDELTGDRIEGGQEHRLHPGDMLFIPADVPHSHRAEGTARLYIIKIPETA